MRTSNTTKPAIVFDLGGVLIDWNAHLLYRRFFDDDEEAIERFMKEVGFHEWNLEQDRGRPFAVAVAELSAQYPHHAHLIRAYDDLWEESVAGAIQPTVEILQTLKQTGYPLYALSNWSQEKFELMRPKFAFLEWFDDIVISGAVRLIKPDQRIFNLFLERVGRPAEECLFIDDSRANIAVSAGLGFRTILFESPQQLEKELQQLGLTAKAVTTISTGGMDARPERTNP